MEINVKLHSLQTDILKRLSVTTQLRFNDLLIDGLESEHMNYHLKKLIEYGLVEKKNNKYELSGKGKDYVNLLDDQTDTVEKQPKSSILIYAVRKNKNGEVEHLLTKRLKQPYLGKVGMLSGKMRFGESAQQAAERELYEETGLKAKDYKLEEIHHKVRFKENGTFVQDVYFYIFFVTGLYGDFIEKTPFQENLWLSQEQLDTQKDINVYRGMRLGKRMKPKKLEFTESIELAEGF